MQDILVTGLPRSGSSVVCALIDYLPDSVGLNSPARQLGFPQKPVEALPCCKWLVGDFVWTRQQLLRQEPVEDFRQLDGTPLFDGMHDSHITRDENDDPVPVMFSRPGLTPAFTLAMRQHTLYTSLLPTLVQFDHFKIFAVIRRPLSVLTDWQHLPQPFLAPGRPHGIARFWPEALDIATSNTNKIDRAVQLYDAYLQRYHELRDYLTIIKYEDITRDPMMMSRLLGKTSVSAAAALITPQDHLHDPVYANALRESYQKYGIISRLYYPDV